MTELALRRLQSACAATISRRHLPAFKSRPEFWTASYFYRLRRSFRSRPRALRLHPRRRHQRRQRVHAEAAPPVSCDAGVWAAAQPQPPAARRLCSPRRHPAIAPSVRLQRSTTRPPSRRRAAAAAATATAPHPVAAAVAASAQTMTRRSRTVHPQPSLRRPRTARPQATTAAARRPVLSLQPSCRLLRARRPQSAAAAVMKITLRWPTWWVITIMPACWQ